jgi:hypothetical protein
MENGVIAVETASEWFLASEEATQDARKNSERDRDYYDNRQLTAEEISELKKRGQPPIVINRIKRKIDFLTGLEKQQRTDPRAFPRNPGIDEAAAHAATDAMRYVVENTQYDTHRSRAWKNSLIEGIGGVRVDVVPGKDGPEVDITCVSFDRFFYDPHSSAPDFSDARYLGEVVWMDAEDAIAIYGEKYKDGFASVMAEEGRKDTYDDKPKWQLWADTKRKRVRIVQMWYRAGDGWHFIDFCKGVTLAEGVSPDIGEDGTPEHPYEMFSAYVDRDNARYGVVREMIDPQDEINKRRSKALHLLTMRQVHMEDGAVDDIAQVKSELARPDGVVVTQPGLAFKVLDTSDLAMGQAQLLQEAKAEIDAMGPNPSLAGKGDDGQSGRAILAQQQGGLVELGDLLDNLRQFDVRVYRRIWRRVQQNWTAERWVRITDNENNVRFAGLNVQTFDQFGRPMGVQNNVAEMDVDIIIEDAPDVTTLQGEQFETLMQLLPVLAQMPPQFAELAIRMAPNLRDKEQILELLRAGQQQRAQAAQAQAQIAMQKEAGEMAKTAADTKYTQARAISEMADAAKTVSEASNPIPVGLPQYVSLEGSSPDAGERAKRDADAETGIWRVEWESLLTNW